MLENPSIDSSSAVGVPSSVKRYAPPNQRNRSLGRRKSGGSNEALDRANSYGNDGEKNQLLSGKIPPTVNQGDLGRSRKSSPGQLIPLPGCCNSEAFQLLNDRWAAAMHAYNTSPEDSSERPVLYSRRSPSPWGQGLLPHLLMQQPGSNAPSGSQKDFLSELQNAIHSYTGNSAAENIRSSSRVGGGENPPHFQSNPVIR